EDEGGEEGVLLAVVRGGVEESEVAVPPAATQHRRELDLRTARTDLFGDVEALDLQARLVDGPARVQHRVRDRGAVEGCLVDRSEEHTSELQSRFELVCRLLLE